MLTRGMFHAVTDKDLKQLRGTKDGPRRRNLITFDWDERWPEQWRCSTDKSWKLIFTALGYQPGPSGGRTDIGHGLGADMFYGKSLHRPNFYVIGLVPWEWLLSIRESLTALDEGAFKAIYFSAALQTAFNIRRFYQLHEIDPTEDPWRQYSWLWLQRIRDLLCRAADERRSLVFTAENC